MYKKLMGSAEIGNLTLDYYLITEFLDIGRADYGVELRSSCGERTCVRGVTVSYDAIHTLLLNLMVHTVTPVALRDVIDDWLL